MPHRKGIKIDSETFSHLSINDQNAAIFKYLVYIEERIDRLAKKFSINLKVSALLTFVGAFMGGFCAYLSGGKLVLPWFVK